MDCRKAQERILESLDGALSPDSKHEVDLHLSNCKACAHFAESQKKLDIHLSAGLSAPKLNPGFRASLRQRIRRQPQDLWPDLLPDAVHLVGCGLAVVVSVLLLPFPSANILSTGVALTVSTYLLQLIVRSSLEDREDASC